jgi:cytochrome c biogenesis protein CcdA
MDFIDPPLALLAGVLTIASPCVLPLLPVVLGTSVDRGGRARPLFIVSGFVLAFAALGVALSLLSQSAAFAHEAVRGASTALLALFGLLRIWPRPYDWLAARLGGSLQRLTLPSGGDLGGNAGGFVLGMSLGAVWTPCAGPVLASILILVAKAQDIAHSGVLLLLFAIGAGIPMLGIAYGGRFIAARVRRIARYSGRLQQGFGVLLILTAAAIHFQYDVLAYAWISGLFQ